MTVLVQNPETRLIAFADESLEVPERLYIVAAALVVPADVAELVRELSLVPRSHAPRVHWRNEAEEIRM